MHADTFLKYFLFSFTVGTLHYFKPFFIRFQGHPTPSLGLVIDPSDLDDLSDESFYNAPFERSPNNTFVPVQAGMPPARPATC